MQWDSWILNEFLHKFLEEFLKASQWNQWSNPCRNPRINVWSLSWKILWGIVILITRLIFRLESFILILEKLLEEFQKEFLDYSSSNTLTSSWKKKPARISDAAHREKSKGTSGGNFREIIKAFFRRYMKHFWNNLWNKFWKNVWHISSRKLYWREEFLSSVGFLKESLNKMVEKCLEDFLKATEK